MVTKLKWLKNILD